MRTYYRPILQTGAIRPPGAQVLAGGWCWWTEALRLSRGEKPQVLPASDVPAAWLARLAAPRARIGKLSLEAPVLMGILNVTPDSFSDGGRYDVPEEALAHARQMAKAGAHLIDVGGESTRPGAALVDEAEEIARVVPVIEGIRGEGLAEVSIDTRKAAVGRRAVAAGAGLINDVSGFTFDPDLAQVAIESTLPVCVMHTQGTPETMQSDPRYGDVLLDVYDWLEARITDLVAAGIPRARILADPGIGFGKTFDHNLTLLRHISLFHGLGVGLLLGVSRKGFIGHVASEPDAMKRGPGSIAVALSALGQGVQVIRAHDVAEHAQAIALWRACMA